MAEALLSLRGIRKSFEGHPVLKGIDLDIARGEFLTLLGPSGCGKTTTLRVIAGLETPDAGQVYLNGQDITALPPEKRPLNTVFQNYALFPHMTVFDNMAYGLRMAGVPKKDIKDKVMGMLAMVQLENMEKRMPSQLSGGQKQRVAIGRALVLSPELLLLDEPLGALDLHLRRQMQGELKELQTRADIAFVYVTHDQEEALTMSDRIALMNNGNFEQLGAPQELYDHPKTTFAAQFIGQTNLLHGVIAAKDGLRGLVQVGGVTIPVQNCALSVGDRACLSIRRERLHLRKEPTKDTCLSAIVEGQKLIGGMETTTLRADTGDTLVMERQVERADTLQKGMRVFLSWDPALAPVTADEEDLT